ncbi:hypothetical protein [uncultured Rhodoblastus sp.]|nr:hypothetical protein [uncultured Rhodoblastus sp.]
MVDLEAIDNSGACSLRLIDHHGCRAEHAFPCSRISAALKLRTAASGRLK